MRPPPEGVDPTRLESYLTDDDFQVRQSITTTHKKIEKVFCPFFFFFLLFDCFLLRPSVVNLGNWIFFFFLKGNDGHGQAGILRSTRLETDTIAQGDWTLLKKKKKKEIARRRQQQPLKG